MSALSFVMFAAAPVSLLRCDARDRAASDASLESRVLVFPVSNILITIYPGFSQRPVTYRAVIVGKM
jgi:hypothetical protein